MKTKTITCHDVYNHGASLQAYALQTHLREQGHESQIIDYKPPYLSQHYRLTAISSNRWGRNPIVLLLYILAKLPRRLLRLQRKRAFDRFREQYLTLTAQRYDSNEALKSAQLDADAIIAGSDQIWNSVLPNGRDAAFYLDFAEPSTLKISYAASFAAESVEPGFEGFVADKLKALDQISVRESSGVKLVEQLAGRRAQHVCDPVLLLNAQQWDSLAVPIDEGGYVLVYDFDVNPKIREIAERLAKAKGLKILALNEGLSYASSKYIHKGPQHFVSLIKGAEHVVTNSFHAIIFSLIYRRDIMVVPRSENLNARLENLMTSFGMVERYGVDPQNALSLKEIDYKAVWERLDVMISSSKRFLAESLASKNAASDAK